MLENESMNVVELLRVEASVCSVASKIWQSNAWVRRNSTPAANDADAHLIIRLEGFLSYTLRGLGIEHLCCVASFP